MMIWVDRIYTIKIRPVLGAVNLCPMEEGVNEWRTVYYSAGNAKACICGTFLLQCPDGLVGSGVIWKPSLHEDLFSFLGLLIMPRKHFL